MKKNEQNMQGNLASISGAKPETGYVEAGTPRK